MSSLFLDEFGLGFVNFLFLVNVGNNSWPLGHLCCVASPLAPKQWRLAPIHVLDLGRVAWMDAEKCCCHAHVIALKEGHAAPGLMTVCGCLAHGSANVVRTSIFASFDPTSSHLINKP
ncbi:hypothetical protein HAX54_002674 [Datura stramonium]|uniref:Uncharacterized protein n=1 Tax=Datura stramonium TaxID=4076 RepID=A0ABS8RTA9_DATST|nr:hypothetical protein [Datura stramonium]